MRAKIGLAREESEDVALVRELLAAMHAGRADFTLTFRRLCDSGQDARADGDVVGLFAETDAIAAWFARWRSRLQRETRPPQARAAAMRSVNPAVIPRNHRIEEAIVAAVAGDLAPFERLHAALARPFEEDAAAHDLALPPAPHERVLRTFCGT
jgi:uncharacterized protein YdiU (UPF0061 family)